MKSWSTPLPETLANSNLPVLQLPSGPINDPNVGLYVCGITPYDATHMGHAATYVTFDTVYRYLLARGQEVEYAQNITDIDEPLLARAQEQQVEWQDLAHREIALFRTDMEALRVLPPTHYVGVVESMDWHIAAIAELQATGATYSLPVPEAHDPATEARDLYLDISVAPHFGEVSHLAPPIMERLSAQRGGDPERVDKRNPLDPRLWSGRRENEPFWESPWGQGRPGWHIECTAIARNTLGKVTIQGGGEDLIFPHHEMTSAQSEVLGTHPFAPHFLHQALVSFAGAKMSKSDGNLILISRLRQAGVDPLAIRLMLLNQRYNSPWEYFDTLLAAAQARLHHWQRAVASRAARVSEYEQTGIEVSAQIQQHLAAAIANNLDTPTALSVIDAWARQVLDGDNAAIESIPGVRASISALLGVHLP